MSVRRFLGFALALLSFVAILAGARDARGEAPGPRSYPLFVLAVDTEDADDQAEALTGALRSRVRGAQGWSLAETTVTLSMLTAALKCQRVPDAACLTRIGDQLRADRFVWGSMQKAPGNTVKVELHLWLRGKAETIASDSYTDNLKDQNDERLQRVAQRLFDRLTGANGAGSLVVHAGDASGAVFVDGQKRGNLERGEATLDLPAGTHVVEVRANGFAPSKDNVTIGGGKEARLTVTLTPTAAAPPGDAGGAAGPNMRKVGGWITLGVGAALLVASTAEAIAWANNKSQAESDVKPSLGLFGGSVCSPTLPAPSDPSYPAAVAATSNACKKSDELKRTSTLAVVFGAAGAVATGVGLYLILTDGSSSEKKAPKFEDRAGKNDGPKIRLVPSISPVAQGMVLEGAF